MRLLGIAVAVRLGLAGRGARQRAAERRERRRALLVGRIELGADVGLDRSEAGEVRVEVVRALAQLAREVAQLLGEPRPRIVRRLPPCRRAPRRPDRSARPGVRPPRGPAAAGRSRRPAGSGAAMTGTSRRAATQRDGGRLAREARPEQAGRRRADRARGRRGAGGGRTGRSRRPRRPARTRRRSASSAAGPAEPGNATASSSALETRSPSPPSASTASAVSPTAAGPHPGDQPAEQTDERDRSAETGARSSGTNRATVQSTSFRDHDRRQDDPRPPDEPAQPQPSPVGERGCAKSDELGIERARRASQAGPAGPRSARTATVAADDGASRRRAIRRTPSLRLRTASQAPATGR